MIYEQAHVQPEKDIWFLPNLTREFVWFKNKIQSISLACGANKHSLIIKWIFPTTEATIERPIIIHEFQQFMAPRTYLYYEHLGWSFMMTCFLFYFRKSERERERETKSKQKYWIYWIPVKRWHFVYKKPLWIRVIKQTKIDNSFWWCF